MRGLFVVMSVIFLTVSCSGDGGKSAPFIETPGTNGTVFAYDGKSLYISYMGTNFITNTGLNDPIVYASNILLGVQGGKLWKIEISAAGLKWSQFGEGTSLFTDSGFVYSRDGNRLRYYLDFVPQNSFEIPGGMNDVRIWGSKFLIGTKDGKLTIYESDAIGVSPFRVSAELPEAMMWIVHPSSPYIFYTDRNDRLFVYNIFSKAVDFIDAPPFPIMRMEILVADNSLMVYGAERVFVYAECANRNITGIPASPLDIASEKGGKFYYFLYPGKVEILAKDGGMKEGELKF
ncbi:MAG: hypothetical protein A2014_02865 [Spirochaetes bacterium GWF1_49_6]|nr:MAG: hypothetical protein A2014_02865 [Spirochaetes bacterium GWF1_49_6]